MHRAFGSFWACCCAREGNFVEAISVFEDLRSDYPEMFETHNNLAVLYAELGRLDDTRGALIAALELRPDAVVYANLGDVYARLAQRAYAHARQLSTEPAATSQSSATVEPTSEPPAKPAETAEEEDEAVARSAETAEAVAAEAEPPAPVGGGIRRHRRVRAGARSGSRRRVCARRQIR